MPWPSRRSPCTAAFYRRGEGWWAGRLLRSCLAFVAGVESETDLFFSQNLLPLPAGASAALVKPTKYHYYPHNQHIYLLPECAIQQVCNAVYVRLNWTQPLCACPSRYRDPCSASLNSDDLHTTELVTSSERKVRKRFTPPRRQAIYVPVYVFQQQQQQQQQQRALTLIKTCEPTSEMRACRRPRDWSLLALQNVRTGKSHYLVICRCPDGSALDGPMSHDQPTYASVPGIRVYGMMCVQTRAVASSGQPGEHSADTRRRGRPLRVPRGTAAAVKRIARRMSRDVLPEAATVPPVDR